MLVTQLRDSRPGSGIPELSLRSRPSTSGGDEPALGTERSGYDHEGYLEAETVLPGRDIPQGDQGLVRPANILRVRSH